MNWQTLPGPRNDRRAWISPEGEVWVLEIHDSWPQHGSRLWTLIFAHPTYGRCVYWSEDQAEITTHYRRILTDPVAETVLAIL